MAKEKGSPDADVSRDFTSKVPLPTDNLPTMSPSAKPKSSTSEATKTQTKRRTIKRCGSSEEESNDDSISESTKTPASKPLKPKTVTTKKQVTEEPIDVDDDDEEEMIRKTVTSSSKKKQPLSKKPTLKRVHDSDDDDIVLTSKPKKPKGQASTSSSSKKQAIKSSAQHDEDDDSEPDIIDVTPRSTKSKSKATQKRSVGSTIPSLTKKQTFKTPKDDDSENDEEEEDSSDDEAPNIALSERKGDLFTAPPNTLLVHACNCLGSWGAGIAAAFKKTYPDHFALYTAHCKSKTPNTLLSTCYLIPPQPSGPKHWIGCLFTSRKYGRGKDSKDDIMDSTDAALQNMLEQLEDLEKQPAGIWMCKINSGSFRVPWSQTKAMIEKLTFKGGLHIQVVDKK
ncbi:hypothetical protein E4T48_02165 [Aureobasidium sp. EXF-10727]|nr:hypothetical protein E4T48_02165 [Aureobasidium sp. EXF-10727]